MIYFDAITSYTRTYSSSVSKHPLSKGSNITDHISKENPSFSFSAFVSNGGWSNVFGVESSPFDILSDIRFYNGRPQVQRVSVSLDTNSFVKYLPDSLTQFFSSDTSRVSMDEKSDTNYTLDIETSLIEISESGELVTLYEFNSDGSLRKDALSDVAITSVAFAEDADTGDGLNIDISCEKIFYVYSQTATIPKDVAASVGDKASSTQDKGQKQGAGPGVEGATPSNQKETKEQAVSQAAIIAGMGNVQPPTGK